MERADGGINESCIPLIATDVMEREAGCPSDNSRVYEVLSQYLRRVSAIHGVSVEEVLAGDRKYRAVHVRREILEIGTSRFGIPVAPLSRWMGIKESAAWYLLNSGRKEKKDL